MRRRSADFRQYHKRCTRFTQTLHKGAPFFAEPQRGGFAVCGRRDRRGARRGGMTPYPRRGGFAVPTARGRRRTHGGGQKGRTTCGFPSSLNSYLSLRGHGGNRRTATASKKGERQSGYCSVTFSAFSQFTDSVLLHIRATLRWVRHNSAARFVSALLRTVSAKINCTKRLIRRCHP